MKTIAITIDEQTLNSIEEILKRSPAQGKSRSRIIREAIKDFVAREQQQKRESRERKILNKHRNRLARQAQALISEQAKP